MMVLTRATPAKPRAIKPPPQRSERTRNEGRWAEERENENEAREKSGIKGRNDFTKSFRPSPEERANQGFSLRQAGIGFAL